MPYENEHSARLKDPKDFKEQPDWAKKGQKFARSPDGKIYGKIKVPSTVDVVWGQLKNQSGKQAAPQSLRFPTKNWTATEAKKWLKDNNVKYQRFEPAKKEEKQSMSENTAPTKACIFNDNAEVTFAKDDSGKESNKFKIVGYSGGIIKNHWFWGNLGLDLKGMKFAKNRTPILAEHFRDVRIGFTTSQEITDQVIVEGPFLDNEEAQKLRADILKGFPMEASLLVPPLVVEHVKEGASVKVNGHTLKGPGAVFRQCTIKEVSMCVFGADSDTKSSAYADIDNQNVKFNLLQENIMDETQITSVENFAEQYPEIHEEIFEKGKTEGFAEGQTAERNLFTSLKDVCGDDHELLVQCYSEGKTAAEAMQLRVEKLEKDKTQLSEKVTELQKKKPVDLAVTEFTDESTSPGDKEKGKVNEEAWKQEFSASEDLQAEFGNVDSYVAFKKAEKEGSVRIAHQV